MNWQQEDYPNKRYADLWRLNDRTYPFMWLDTTDNKRYYCLSGLEREEFPDSVTSHEERCVYVETMWRMA